MVKLVPFSLSIVFCFTFSIAISSDLVLTESQLFSSFNKQFKQIRIASARSCSYTVITKTSCSSSSQTRDKISLAFGDTYGHEVYVPRLDDPSSKTFEKCFTDTFQIQGPCMYEICYLYLLRVGSDGWKPESVKLYGADGRATMYYFNKFLPNGVWFGYNNCNKSVS